MVCQHYMKHTVNTVSNLDYFSRGLIKAFERRRAMQQQTMQEAQTVDKADHNSYVITTNVTTKTLSDEQYKTIITSKMITYIKNKGATK